MTEEAAPKLRPIKTSAGLLFGRLGLAARRTYGVLPREVVLRLCGDVRKSEGVLKSLAGALDDAAATWLLADRSASFCRSSRVAEFTRHAEHMVKAIKKLDVDEVEQARPALSVLGLADGDAAIRVLELALSRVKPQRGPIPNDSLADMEAWSGLLEAWKRCTNAEPGVGYNRPGTPYRVYNTLAKHLRVGRPRTMFRDQGDFPASALQDFRAMLEDQEAYVRAVERRQSQNRRE